MREQGTTFSKSYAKASVGLLMLKNGADTDEARAFNAQLDELQAAVLSMLHAHCDLEGEKAGVELRLEWSAADLLRANTK